ncbi:MAG: NUDIX domain-containing protein [bacterium]
MSDKVRKYCPYCGSSVTDKYEGDILRKYCTTCQLYFYDNPLPVVSAIVTRGREVLLVKRRFEPHEGMWCLPSGFAESGESIQAATLRELAEETGLNGEITGFIDTDSVTDDLYGDLIFLTFEVDITGGHLEAGDDAVEARYFSLFETPELAFPSNTKAIRTYINTKSEFWAIIDSFTLSVSHPEDSHLKPNFLSNILVEVIKGNINVIADRWIQDVKRNRSTPTYHPVPDNKLRIRFQNDTNQYVKWLTGDYVMEEMIRHYQELGALRKKQGYMQSELISALSLIRKYIWEFALSQGMWQKTIDIYRTLELERRMMLFFDKASYHACRGYEEAL